MVLPTLIGLGVALAVITAAAAVQLRCADAAWEAARGLARGEPPGFAEQTVHRFGPKDASVFVDSGGGTVSVRVEARLPFGSSLIPALRVAGSASLACEPGTPCADGDDGDDGDDGVPGKVR